MQVSFNKQPDPRFSSCIISNKKGTKAVIHPAYGASLQELYFNNTPVINNIIKDKEQAKMLNSSCSAILFPFANRINDGQYSYKNKKYQLACNEVAKGHALHGLVYKKYFDTEILNMAEDHASVAFSYTQNDTNKGFPFPFTIRLIYTLWENHLSLDVVVENTGTESFPFSLGWHPYFHSSNLEKSQLSIDSKIRVLSDERMIPTETESFVFPTPLPLKEQEFDDAYLLSSNEITYQTPDYTLAINTLNSDKEQYVQLYTPSHRKSIAIEPMTAAADCFNNNLGGQELAPNDSYKLTWILEYI